MCAACMERDKEKCDGGVYFVGILQFVFGFLLVGYIWSIVWGVRIYSASKPKVVVVNMIDSEANA